MKRACRVPRCSGYAVPRGRGGCERHQETTTQRGYGLPHQRVRRELAATLPAPCGYCGKMLRLADDWVAAHRVDGNASAGYVPAHSACNERAKTSRYLSAVRVAS
jgi:hypothetical protein